MDLKSLNASDLTDVNLGSLLTEIENALKNENYADVKLAVDQINSFLVTPGIVNVDSNGKNTITLSTGEVADIGKISTEIFTRVQNDINTHTTTNVDRDKLIAEMNKYLTSMFNQQNLSNELVKRGFSIDKFKDYADKANQDSRTYIEELKRSQKDREKVFEKLLGKDSIIKTGSYSQKSYSTIIGDCKRAITSLEVAKKQFTQLDSLKTSRASETDPNKQAKLDEQIKRAENNLKYLANSVKKLDIKGVDKHIFDDWETDANRAKATTNITAQLANVETEIDSTYKNLAKRVTTLTDAEKAELGINSTIEDAILNTDNTDPAILKSSRQSVDKYLEDASKSMNVDIASAIRREERLIDLRNKNVEQYKEIYDRISSTKAKPKTQPKVIKRQLLDIGGNPVIDTKGNPVMTEFIQVIDSSTKKPVYVDVDDGTGKITKKPKYEPVLNSDGTPKIDRDGNPYYKVEYEQVMENGKPKVDPTTGKPVYVQEICTEEVPKVDPTTGNPVLDGAGKPVMEQKPVMDIQSLTNDDRDYYLQKGFDETAVLAKIDSLKRSEKRSILKGLKIGNVFTRFFAAGRLWKKHDIRNRMLTSSQNKFIKKEALKEYEEVIINNQERNAFEKLFDRIKKSAQVQHQLYNAGKDQGTDAKKVDKTDLQDELEAAVYEEVLYRSAKVGKDEITDIRKAKGDSYQDNVEKHAKRVQTQHNDILHNDVDDDLEL